MTGEADRIVPPAKPKRKGIEVHELFDAFPDAYEQLLANAAAGEHMTHRSQLSRQERAMDLLAKSRPDSDVVPVNIKALVASREWPRYAALYERTGRITPYLSDKVGFSGPVPELR